MSTETEDQAEYKAALTLMGREELLAMKGDSAEEDALIDQILEEGKAVAMKGKEVEVADELVDANGKPIPVKAKAPAADDADDADDEEDDAEAVAAAAAAAKAKPAGDAPAPTAEELAAEAAANAAAAPAVAEADLPKLDLAPLDTRYQNDLKALDEAKAKSFGELMDGTITAEAYSKIESQYMADRDSLKDDLVDRREWLTEVHKFKVDVARSTGINYDADTEKGQAWDDWVKRLAAKPENADKPGSWYLEMAHKKVMAEFDITPTTPKTVEKAAENVAPAKKVAEKTGRAPKLDNIPPTLGGLPAASPTDDAEGGEFAHLANLSGMDFERALARLTPEQKDRYERS